MSKRKTILISLLILLIGAAITAVVFLTEPTAQKGGATKKTAMLVDVIEVHKGNYQPVIVATGTVQPSKDIVLSPRVTGEITEISDAFVPGTTIKKGTQLLKIDPADYKNNLKLRQSDLRLAEADLKLEMGQQDVAQQDYNLIGDSLSPDNRSLVLRKPQLQSARANLEAAQAAVQQAKLNLERTSIQAPFDAHVIRRNANTGSQVAPGNDLGRLVGTNEYWVVANVPVSKVNWLTFSENDAEKGAAVKIQNKTAWNKEEYRTGRLFRLIGALEDQTRLARVLITVADPLGIQSDTVLPQLIIGSFVETHIQAREVSDVVRLNRDYLRQEDKVWVMDEGKLSIRDVNILFKDAKYAYIKEGLNDGEKVVTTNLSTVVEGAGLRTESKDTSKAKVQDNG